MSTLAKESVLETLAESIFEEIVKSFKDLTPSEEQIVYDCACEEAIKATESSSLKEIGKVIKYLKENSPSSLDMSLASKMIREKLQK